MKMTAPISSKQRLHPFSVISTFGNLSFRSHCDFPLMVSSLMPSPSLQTCMYTSIHPPTCPSSSTSLINCRPIHPRFTPSFTAPSYAVCIHSTLHSASWYDPTQFRQLPYGFRAGGLEHMYRGVIINLQGTLYLCSPSTFIHRDGCQVHMNIRNYMLGWKR